MKTRELLSYLDSRFLPEYQESYDNAGFLVGDGETDISGVLVTLDVTPEVIDEAIDKGLNVIVSHHPLIFGGLKRITTNDITGRMIAKLIKNNIAVYAAHTNLDNLECGINGILAEKLGLTDCHILRPLEGTLRKLVTYVPTTHAEQVRTALFEAGAGGIGGYDCCSYNISGTGTFRASEGCTPFCGEIGKLHHEEEIRIEMVYEKRIESKLIKTLIDIHPYEEPAYDCIPIANKYPSVGAGMVGELPTRMPLINFLDTVKQRLNLPMIRVSGIGQTSAQRNISKVAICGGSGSFLIDDARAAGADIYLTADLKYHDFQQGDNRLILADIGHYESEQFAKEIICKTISEKFSTFACQISERNKGYVSYI